MSFYWCVVNTGDSREAPVHCIDATSSCKFCIRCVCCILCISWQTYPCICCVHTRNTLLMCDSPVFVRSGWPWIKFCWPQGRKNSLPHFDFHPPQVKINQVFIGLKWENILLCKVSQSDFLTYNFSSNLQFIWSRPSCERTEQFHQDFSAGQISVLWVTGLGCKSKFFTPDSESFSSRLAMLGPK